MQPIFLNIIATAKVSNFMIIRFSNSTRLLPPLGVRRDSSCEIADDDDDEENAMMSVIEEVPEESDSLIENNNCSPTRRRTSD